MSARGWSLQGGPAKVLGTLGIFAARRAALMRAGIELQSVWKDELNQPGTGTRYPAGSGFITKGGKVIPIAGAEGSRSSAHTASAPGAAPAPDTGELRRSIAVAEMGDEVRVGTGLRYGLALEYGVNVSGSKTGPHPGKNFVLQPRPHARPAKAKATGAMTKGVRLEFASKVRAPRLGE